MRSIARSAQLRDELGDLLFQIVFTREWPRSAVGSISRRGEFDHDKLVDGIRTCLPVLRLKASRHRARNWEEPEGTRACDSAGAAKVTGHIALGPP